MSGSDARALALALAGDDDAALTALFASRALPPAVTWDDFFDAADALLEPASLLRALTHVTAATGAALRRAVDTGEAVPSGDDREALRRLALVDDSGTVFAALRALWPDVPHPTSAAPASTAAPESDAQAAERAFAASGALADILSTAWTTPLARIGSGALGASDRRRIIEEGIADSPEAVDTLVAIAATAGLLRGEERVWVITTLGTTWLATPTVARWSTVADRLRASLPAGIRTSDGGWQAPSSWPAAYPFDPEWPARAAALRTELTRWAVLGADGETATWAAGLATGSDIDTDALQALLPVEVDRVFLQNDLTAIAPGPLDPPLDLRLRSMTIRESRAQASSYRFTADTLSRALAAGETADSLRSFLTSLSLTGLPQPLAYEIDRAARRYGALRVGPDRSGLTRVTSDDAALLSSVAVDQSLRPLGLVPDGDILVTRSSPETVFWMLTDARYPALAVDVDGAPRVLERHRVAPASADSTPDYAPLIARLRAAPSGDAESAWRGRELDQAARAHATLVLRVRLPDGEREFTLEVTGFGGGRVRGRDRVADVERTLPVSSIVEIRPA